MEAIFNPANINPTILYLALLAGLWIAITAAHIGGTGVLELASLVVLGGCIYVLTLMPTNWLALLLLVMGAAAFIVLPYLASKYAHLAELGLVLQAIGGFFLFTNQTVSPVIIAATIFVSWLYNRFVLLPILRAHHRPSDYDDATDVVGERGRVVQALSPVGTVFINGENWSARSDPHLPVGTEIIVMGKRGLELVVEKAKREDAEPYHANGAGNGAKVKS
jgi:membrane-bound serine protease (ClpP class)